MIDRSRRRFLARSAGLAGALWLSQIAPPAAAQAAGGPTRPLILVHGFADQIGTWYRSDNAVVARLLQAGYRWEALQLVPFAFPGLAGAPDSEDAQGDIAAAGLALAQTIRATAARAADGRVDLLGFSMGGLVARWAINYLRGTLGAARPLVNSAVLIAAPNYGADILLWFSKLSTRNQVALDDLARDLANLDLNCTAARQMMPDSEFLQRLNDPGQADDRVRYVVIAGAAQLRLGLGAFATTVGVGDGLISSASATYLPVAPAQSYLASEAIGATGLAPWAAVQRSTVLHPRLLFNDTVALAAAFELAPWSAELRDGLEARLAG